MIKICDAIMGSGKTQAAIHYINTHPDTPFIYITPFLKEADRIKKACPTLHFETPLKKTRYYKSKAMHTYSLIKRGKNIASTHAAFQYYTQDMLEAIRDNGYVLIIDEALDVIQKTKFRSADLDMMRASGYITANEDSLVATDAPYTGTAFADSMSLIRSHHLIRVKAQKRSKEEVFYYWEMNEDLLTSFKEVFVLTYLADGQAFKYYLDIQKLPYEYIGVHRDGDHYSFSDKPDYVPEYVGRIKEMIHILDAPKMNGIADDRNALSVSWYAKHPDLANQVGRNIYNFLRNICGGHTNDIMWSSFKKQEKEFGRSGLKSSFVPFNSRATNEYRGKKYLAYVVNIRMNPVDAERYRTVGIAFDEDQYALSTMVQWIWRSAIRDGEEIFIYIPSKRMRTLLIRWMDSLQAAAQSGRKELSVHE